MQAAHSKRLFMVALSMLSKAMVEQREEESLSNIESERENGDWKCTNWERDREREEVKGEDTLNINNLRR